MGSGLETRKMSCDDLAETGKMLIASAEAINAQIRMWNSFPGEPRARMVKMLRQIFKMLQDMWTDVRMEYGGRPCGSGDLEEDIGSTFPPMAATAS